MEFQRYAMCTQVTTYDNQGRPQLKLDYLDASYLNIMQVKQYQICTVTDDLAAHAEFISYKYYDTVELWWVICMYNAIIDPVREIYSGVSLKIPSLSELTPLIQSKQEALNTTKVVLVE